MDTYVVVFYLMFIHASCVALKTLPVYSSSSLYYGRYTISTARYSSSTLLRKDDVQTINSHSSLVISGPSGVGKGTLISKLLDMYPSKLDLSVSYTSRKPRPGEIDGVHYHFLEKEALKKDIEHGDIKFIEHAKVHDNLYGTRLDDVEKVHKIGKVCILDLDSRGVQQLITNAFPAKYVFINPPSLSILEQRLRARGTETEKQIALRIHNAKNEVAYGLHPDHFDTIITNEDLGTTLDQLATYLKTHFPVIMSR